MTLKILSVLILWYVGIYNYVQITIVIGIFLYHNRKKIPRERVVALHNPSLSKFHNSASASILAVTLLMVGSFVLSKIP